MAARLQAASGSSNPILLLYDTKSGHSGGRSVRKTIEEYTDILSFLFWQLDVARTVQESQATAAALGAATSCALISAWISEIAWSRNGC
jgi:hypothetical protein